ncbi:MAG: hypothetical protein AMJ65_07165 [Phycisphaerae bacterium SG8_4]|nr:MAG: hypothetical protein AMJ65_07165 [Phycisphaerae bacterium SG8_4]
MFKLVTIPQLTWADTETAAQTVNLFDRGQVSQISVKVNDNTGNRTVQVTISDENAGQLYDKSLIPENAVTVYHATKDTEDFHEFVIGPGCTLKVTPSGDPGASGLEVDIVLGMEE